MRRALSALALMTLLLGGCTSGEPLAERAADPLAPPEPGPVVAETALSEEMLCWEANVAIRRIIAELMGAPNSDAALIEQTVMSYRQYAARLRELAGLSRSDTGERAIVNAAEAAERYAQAVYDQNSYKVDISGAIEASRRAFPGCDLEG
jgi:hypothetical protein